jgi:hypothetical protein
MLRIMGEPVSGCFSRLITFPLTFHNESANPPNVPAGPQPCALTKFSAKILEKCVTNDFLDVKVGG